MTTAGEVRLREVGDESRQTLENLWQLYRHDLSESRDYLPQPDGRFPLTWLDHHLTTEGARSYLVEAGDALAGFVLTQPWERGGLTLHDFFVVRALRRKGVGLAAAAQALRAEPGQWMVGYQDYNPGAQPFWERVAREVAGDDWQVETGKTPPGRRPDLLLVLQVPPSRRGLSSPA